MVSDNNKSNNNNITTLNSVIDGSVAVAMSGGADSSAVAVILKERGINTLGITMSLCNEPCAPNNLSNSNYDSKAVAASIGISHRTLDLTSAFADKIINPFVVAYNSGYTPNPCVLCNRAIKFGALRYFAKKLGCAHIATGHYACIKLKESCDTKAVYGLYTAFDNNKDQSYFLYTLTQQDLAHTLFPVGEMRKEDVRNLLQEHGLIVANKKESQDICFVPNGGLCEFIEQRSDKSSANSTQCGVIVDTMGRTMGTHSGIHRYTIGQRRGLAIASSEPLYVVDISVLSNTITVGKKNELERSSFFVGYVNWINGDVINRPFKSLTKVRYRNAGVFCQITPVSDDMVCVTFEDKWSSVSPGQSAVFYGDADSSGRREVLGGGVILKDQERISWLERAMN